ncbi:MAG: acyl carrier protein [Verrucomicrobiae bacterium]|nr:acyl carrier protein [Verrucomicrobiae bacterium]
MDAQATSSDSDPKARIRDFIRTEILESPDEALDDSTPLISDGIMNSLSTLKLVSFLEESFDIQLAAHEISVEYLDSVDQIAEFVAEKQGA